MKRASVHVKNPCNENWGNFDFKGQNRFCQKCDKMIVDFSSMTESEIIEYLKKRKGICGIIKKATPIPTRLRKKNLIINSFFAFGSLFISPIETIPQEKTESKALVQNSFQAKKELNFAPAIDTLQILVSGLVTDGTGEPLPRVNVVIKGTTKGTQTDLDGKYKIKVLKTSILIFSYIGFETHEVEVGGKTRVDVDMNGATELGEVVLIYKWYTPRGMWQRIKRIF